MSKRLLTCLFVASCLIAAMGASSLPQIAVKGNASDGSPAGMQLLPGYQHHRQPGIDTIRGLIWKDGGPQIKYEIGEAGVNAAKTYAQMDKTIWRTTVSTNGASCDLTFDEAQDTVVATIADFASFTATRVKSRRDVSEVLLMIMTYDMHKPH